MYLKWSIPVSVTVHPGDELVNEIFTFTYKRMSCHISLEDSLNRKPVSFGDQELIYMSAEKFDVMLEDKGEEGKNSISKWLSDEDELMKNIFNASNLFLKHLRIVGIAPEIREMVVQDNKMKNVLAALELHYSHNGTEWTKFTINPLELFVNGSISEMIWSIKGQIFLGNTAWEKVAHSLINKSIPYIEMEFVVNSHEYLNKKNYRLAVLEAAIGFEIVFASFCKHFLSIEKQMNASDIEKFLTPQFDLSTRLMALPQLMLTSTEIEEIDFASIRKVITWRNAIVHRRSDIMDDVDKEYVRIKVANVNYAVALFINKRQVIMDKSKAIQD